MLFGRPEDARTIEVARNQEQVFLEFRLIRRHGGLDHLVEHPGCIDACQRDPIIQIEPVVVGRQKYPARGDGTRQVLKPRHDLGARRNQREKLEIHG